MSAELSGNRPLKELGFGKAADQGGVRLLNRDGSFNSERHGLPYRTSRSLYTSLVTMSWPTFLCVVVLLYLVTNLLFALLYLACGEEGLSVSGNLRHGRFATAFFFSVQTLATIGYGQVTPVSLVANCLVTAEALVGLLGFSLATGFLFSRISRPTSRMLFSDHAVIAPFQGQTGFMFRLANGRKSQLIEVEARVILSRLEDSGGKRKREFYPLELEYRKVSFLSLHWTVVHPIVESSPLYGVTEPELLGSDAEFLILLTGIDDVFSQAVHARTSYKAHEVLWHRRFANIYEPDRPGEPLAIDVTRLSETEPA